MSGHRSVDIIRSMAMAAAVIAGVAAVLTSAQAQNYPNRPVRIVLPFAAGGVADITARVTADKLSEKLGQRFVVENTPGAGGIAAARSVLSSPADGYTLAMLTNGTAISVPLFKSLPFDPVKDFTPISNLGNFDCVLAVNAASEFKTLADFLKTAREKPGTLNVGTINVGSTQNLAAELFKSTANVKFVIVPFRASPEVVVAALRNDVQLVLDFHPALKAGILDGKLRPLATCGSARTAYLPNVPTVKEAGVANFDVSSWNALFAPTGTPKEIVDLLNRSVKEVMAQDDVKKRLLDVGVEAKATTPAEIGDRLKADIAKWAKVIEAAGIPKQ